MLKRRSAIMTDYERPYKAWMNDLAVGAGPRDRVALVALSDGLRLLWYQDTVYHTRAENVVFPGMRAEGMITWNRSRWFKNWEIA